MRADCSRKRGRLIVGEGVSALDVLTSAPDMLDIILKYGIKSGTEILLNIRIESNVRISLVL